MFFYVVSGYFWAAPVHTRLSRSTCRRLTTINRWLVEHGHDVVKLWENIDDAIIKTLISCQPALKHNYRTCFPNHLQPGAGSACFEILGFDVLLTSKLKPKVLEVNHSPSFSTDAQIDIDIKEALIWDTFQLINLGQARLTCTTPSPFDLPHVLFLLLVLLLVIVLGMSMSTKRRRSRRRRMMMEWTNLVMLLCLWRARRPTVGACRRTTAGASSSGCSATWASRASTPTPPPPRPPRRPPPAPPPAGSSEATSRMAMPSHV